MTCQNKSVSPKDTQTQTKQTQGQIATPRPQTGGSVMSYQLGFTSGPHG